ncbi:MAG TPA: type II toxin-antitoxin system death-on-curing family toxin [Gemmata sp.]|nr:type II toxin-antitoxin system death-on-curing family toxin [Gemmata sp.]
MIYLTTAEVVQLHDMLIQQSGGTPGIRDIRLIDSAVYQPQATFGGHDLLPTLPEKAAALAFSLVMNHGFVDGNKRIGHAAMETFLVLNGHQLNAGVDEQEAVFLQLAAGTLSHAAFTDWVRAHIEPLPTP